MPYVAPIRLKPAQVPKLYKTGYKGRIYYAVVNDSVHIPMTAGLWSGGSRSNYYSMDLATGNKSSAWYHNVGPWNDVRRDHKVELTSNMAIVEHSIMSGKDRGYTFYIHPDSANLFGL